VTLRIIRRDRALRDLDDLATFIQRDNPQAAIRFLEAAEESFRLLARMPETGTLCEFRNPKTAGFRVRTIKGFENYLVFYRPIANGMEVVRVLHGARDIATIFEDPS